MLLLCIVSIKLTLDYRELLAPKEVPSGALQPILPRHYLPWVAKMGLFACYP